ncbi:MAG: hypothetical protein O7G30_09555 [Proteobacteria bacterium]|nr:hypothetical protein [Pseudomonadota bacterium]
MPQSGPHHLIIVPHTHWDREWYRTHEQFRFRLVRLVDGVLDLLESDPAFRHFTLDGQSVVVDDYLEVRPRSRERLAKLVEAGRLLVGPWYVLPDEWLVSGEALIRNLRLGLQRADDLGGAMRLGYVPDQFGHVGQLPQIFAGFGFDAAVLWRGVGADIDETLFEWEAPDGTRLFTVYLVRSYSNAGHLPTSKRALARRLREEAAHLGRHSRIPTLLLMNGTDHAEPDPALAGALGAALAGEGGISAEIGTLPAFVFRARGEAPADLQRHTGEFRSGLRSPLLPGCASTRMPQKRRDFENDRLLTRYLEPLAAWWGALGGAPDRELIAFLWRIALENHPHDSICGCSIDAVHEQMETRFQRVRELGGAHLERVFSELARHVAVPPDDAGAALVIWNPAGEGPTPVEATVEVDGTGPWTVTDGAGRRLPADVRIVEPETDLMVLPLPARVARMFADREFPDMFGSWVQDLTWQREGDCLRVQLHCGRGERLDGDLAEKREALRELLETTDAETVELAARRRALARVRCVAELPARGLRVIRVCAAKGRAAPGPLRRERLPRTGRATDGSGPRGWAIENEFWRVEVDASGRVAWRHRADGAEQCAGDALRLVSEGDRGDEYNFDSVQGGADVDRPDRMRVSADPLRVGAPCVTVRIRAQYRVPAGLAPDRASRAERTVRIPTEIELRLWAGVDRLDVGVELENTARDHRLRLLLRAPFTARRLEVESAFEVAERPIAPAGPGPGERTPAERPIGATPQRTFASIDDGEVAVTVANRGLAEVEAVPQEDGTTCLALTLLRAVGWLSRDDLVLRPAHAGPPLETPGAQVPGPHRAELSLHVHGAGAEGRTASAHRFAYPPISIQRGLGVPAPSLKDADRLLEVDDPEVVVSAIEPRPDGGSLVRVYNASGTARRVRMKWHGPGASALAAVNLAEQRDSGVRLEATGTSAILSLRPWQIASIRVS